jgi:hypothetical protein
LELELELELEMAWAKAASVVLDEKFDVRAEKTPSVTARTARDNCNRNIAIAVIGQDAE